MKMRRVLGTLGSTMLFLGLLSDPSVACAGGHIQASLGRFPVEAISRPLYWGVEGEDAITLTIRVFDATCDGSTFQVNYQAEDGTAVTGVDYTRPPGVATLVTTPGHADQVQVPFQITDNPLADAFAVQWATFRLTGARNARIVEPSSAPVLIVDDDGPVPRVAFGLTDYSEFEGSGEGVVPVFKAGNGPATVNYSVSDGTATRNEDYVVATGSLSFGASERVKLIPISVIDDGETEGTEELYITLSGPGVVEEPSMATFRIMDNEEEAKPSSSIHHPNHGKRYRNTDYRIREIHVFTEDAAGSGVVRADFALRRNLPKGKCQWWKGGRRFKKGSCDRPRWRRMDKYETDYFYIRTDALRPSTGKVDYTAMSRAVDAASNVETSFDRGRNANTFEVKPGRTPTPGS